MNQAELLQLTIINAVKEGLRLGLEEHIKPLKEDLKQIKALNTKILKEQANIIRQEEQVTVNTGFKPISRPRQVINESQDINNRTSQLNSLKAQAAPYAHASGGELPDIEIPIEVMLGSNFKMNK